MPATRTRMTAVAGPATAVAPGAGGSWTTGSRPSGSGIGWSRASAGRTADPWH